MSARSSRLVAGFWRLHQWGFDAQQTAAFIEQCLELGISSFDLADIYGDGAAERMVGDALALRPELRERMELTTKVDIVVPSERFPAARRHHYDTSAAHIVAATEACLERLRCERIDVLLLHREDPLLDPDAAARAFDQLHAAGKVGAFGVSNFQPSKFELLASRVAQPLVTNQIEMSPLCLDAWSDGTLDQCHRLGIAPMAWSPLAGGRLMREQEPRTERVRRALEVVGDAHGGAPIERVAFAWLLRHPARVRPILGTGRIERVRSTVQALELELDAQEWFDVWCASTGEPLP